jgi:AcrR family transcriptional regulator
MTQPQAGATADTGQAILAAMTTMAQDRSLPRTAASLASLAGISRATLYRALGARPELHDSFRRLREQAPGTERSGLERDLAERLAEIRLLKQRITALATTIEHLIRDNNALRHSLAQPGPAITDLAQHARPA